jgi:hypothetical protein
LEKDDVRCGLSGRRKGCGVKKGRGRKDVRDISDRYPFEK